MAGGEEIWRWLKVVERISSWDEDASKVDGNLSSGLEIITNVLLSNDSFIPIKYRPIRINTKFFWLRVTCSYLESGFVSRMERGWDLVNRFFFLSILLLLLSCYLATATFARKNVLLSREREGERD